MKLNADVGITWVKSEVTGCFVLTCDQPPLKKQVLYTTLCVTVICFFSL